MVTVTVQDIKLVPVSYDVTDQQLEYSTGQLKSWNAALVRVETADGLVGWGDSSFGFQSAERAERVLDRLRPHVEGRSAESVDEIRERLHRSYLARVDAVGVIGAVETALYDVLGKRRDEPLYELLGGPASEGRVQAYGSGGLGATVDQRVDQAVSYAAEGFDVVKVRAMPDTDGTYRLATELADALDPDVEFAIDGASAGATLEESIDVIQRLEDFDDRIAWLEDPVPDRQDLEGYRQARDATDLTVTGMESCISRAEFRQALEYDCADVIHPDVTRGGFDHVRRVSTTAAARNVPAILHVWGSAVMVMANAHYAATDPNCEMMEFCRLDNPLREAFLPDGLEQDGNYLELPDAPGLGVEYPDDLTEEYPYQEGMGHVSFGK